MMATREENIQKIRAAVYGKDVREAIAEGMEQTYGACEEFLRYGFTDDAKEALLALCEKLAYTVENGQDYVDALELALQYKTWMITNNLTHCTTSNAAQSVTKGGSYSATITASAGYVLTGATVSITMGGTDITATAYSNGVISIPAVTGALVITISAAEAQVSSISAVFTQGDAIITAANSLDDLKQYLVVTATLEDTSTATVPSADYTLSGSLTAGTSTITASFRSKTDTFTVSVTALLAFWDFTQSLADSVGNISFTLSGGASRTSNGLVFSGSSSSQFTAYASAENTPVPAGCRVVLEFGEANAVFTKNGGTKGPVYGLGNGSVCESIYFRWRGASDKFSVYTAYGGTTGWFDSWWADGLNPAFFSNKTLTADYTTGKCTIRVDGSTVFESPNDWLSKTSDSTTTFNFGSTTSGNCYNNFIVKRLYIIPGVNS
jgi:hypothetical protein